jgi:hypothetical protein
LAEQVPARLSAAEGRKFALTVGTAFLVLAAITWWRDHLTLSRVFVGIGGLLWIGGLVVPRAMGPVYHFWMGLAHAISKVTTPIFLGIVYFLVIMPIGIIMRALGRNPIVHRAHDGSYWAPHGEARGSLKNQF